MIMREFYDRELADTLLLLGSTLKREASDAIYDRIKANFINADFREALNYILSPEREIHKFSFPVLLKALNVCRAKRFEKEHDDDRAKEREDIERFWNRDREETCITRQCATCPKIAGRCDTIAKTTIEAIKLMMRREWRPKRPDEDWQGYYREMREQQSKHWRGIYAALAVQFPGVGFEIDWDERKKRIITRVEAHNHAIREPKVVRLTTAAKPRADLDGDFVREE